MTTLLSDIAWSDPLLPAVHDAAWEAELKRRGARVGEIDRRVAPSAWLREAAYEAVNYAPAHLPDRLYRIGNMVTAQENACRYCYGATRAYMRVIGFSEAFIQKVERDAQLAELDTKERAYLAYCRSLARSRPRPAEAERAALMRDGYTATQIAEITSIISIGCFFNRVTTLLACPPEAPLDRMANSPVRFLYTLAMPLMRKLGPARPVQAAPDAATLAGGPFGMALAPLAGLDSGRVMKAALDGAFASGALSRAAKALMFAVVARTLGCPHCEAEATRLLTAEGFEPAEIDGAISTLRCARLAPREAGLLAWARDTVSYVPSTIQRSTRALAAQLGADGLLEAIGVASLANGTVRLAMLLK